MTDETPIESVKRYLAMLDKAFSFLLEEYKITPAGFVMKHGVEFPFDKSSFDIRRGKTGECYKNAGQLALRDESLTYVEGYAVVCGIPIEHGWIVTPAGHVKDPTLRWRKLLSNAPVVSGYFGVPMQTEYLRQTLMRSKFWGVFHHRNVERILRDDPTTIVRLGEWHDDRRKSGRPASIEVQP